ncbi:hypothetical protein HY251_18180 [bacterium]|nr:hypothetical protein [bacterium]
MKLQVAGPNVLAKHVRDVAAVWTLGERETGRRVAIERPVAFFREALARLECPAVVVFDEPSSFTAILEGTPGNHPLTRAIELARSVGAAAVGVHDCGPFFGEALAAKPDLLSFDFATYEKRLLGGEAETVAPFVRAGGSLAWGVVPTRAGEARGFDVPAAAGRVRQAATALMGGEAGGRALLERSLVTPACGTALLSPEEAVSVHEAALEVARLLRES